MDEGFLRRPCRFHEGTMLVQGSCCSVGRSFLRRKTDHFLGILLFSERGNMGATHHNDGAFIFKEILRSEKAR